MAPGLPVYVPHDHACRAVYIPHDDARGAAQDGTVYIPYDNTEHKTGRTAKASSKASIGNAAEDERNRLLGAGLNDVLGLRLLLVGFHG